MQMHEHYEELCALAAISELSAEEHQELMAHLDACDRCRRVEENFTLILDQLPAAYPPKDTDDVENLLGENYERRFDARAAAEGIRFSAEATRSTRLLSSRFSSLRTNPSFKLVFAVSTALTLAGLVLVGRGLLAVHPESQVLTSNHAVPIQEAETKSASQTVTRSKIPSAQPRYTSTTTPDLDSERRIKALQQQLAQALKEKEQVESDLSRLRQELASVKERSDQDEKAVSEANREVDRLQQSQNQMVATLVERQNKLDELNEQLNVQRSSAERDRELSAVTSEVRDLMGARNLHIIDVNDYDDRLHKRGKSFGRVFYCEGKSLIFYAFDLSQKTSASKVIFQAWGQRMGGDAVARNLGTFNIDDHVQRRWVLRVNDPKLLSSIDSLFVTVEPSPGRDQPSGKRLLFAYLGTEANHP
jgi:hypothetical protein